MKSNLILIDEELKDNYVIKESCNHNTVFKALDYNCANLIYDNISLNQELKRIAVIFHNDKNNTNYKNCKNHETCKTTKNKFIKIQNFLLSVVKSCEKLSIIDFISCELNKDESWLEYFNLLKTSITNKEITINATENYIGNEKYGGSWSLNGCDLMKEYFNKNILNYQYLLGSATISGFATTSITTSSVSFTFTVSGISGSVYLYRYSGTSASNPLTNIATLATTININGTQTYTASGLTQNQFYSFAFYNGNTSGSATQITSVITIKTFESATSLTLSSNTETSTDINYTLNNTLSVDCTAYLYRFSSDTVITPPSSYDSSGTLVNSIGPTSNGTSSGTITDSSVSSNRYNIYALYDGNTNGSKILTSTSNVNMTTNYISFATISSLTNTKSNTTSAITYSITNNLSQSSSSYLYRFSGSSAPSSDPSSGTLIGSTVITTANGGTSNGTINDTGLTTNTQYTYAFYNDNSSSGTILRNTSRSIISTTLTTLNLVNSTLSLASFSSSAPTTISINYTIANNPGIATSVYLYRFVGSAPGDNKLSNSGTLITTLSLTANSTTSNTYNDSSSISLNTDYTYCFFDGNVVGTSNILTSDINTYTPQTLSVNTTITTVAFTTTTNIMNTTATVNFTLTNTNNTSTSYLYIIAGASISATLPVGATYIGSATSGSASILNLSSLTRNTQYTYAFYGGTVIGSSKILTNISSINQSVTFYTTNLLCSTLSSSSIKNTSAVINYTVTNSNGGSVTTNAYLYKFTSLSSPATPPSILDTSNATLIRSLTNFNTTQTSTYTDTGLTTDTYYGYAFYNGTTNGSSTILSNSSNTNMSTTLTTSNIVLNSLTASSVTITNGGANGAATVSYNISNNTTNTTLYLYRFTSTPAVTLSTSGNGASSTSVAINSTSVNSSTVYSSLTTPEIYYFAFYDGTTSGSSQIVTISGQTQANSYVTVKDYIEVTSLTTSNLTSITSTNYSININYTAKNNLTTSQTIYLYRFIGLSAPSSNPTSGTQITSVSINSGITTTSSYTDTTLANNLYTYAFYNGNTSSAKILADTTTNTDMTTFIASIPYISSSITASGITTSAANISVTVTNPLPATTTVYLVRYLGTSVPSTLNSSGVIVTSISNISANDGTGSLTNYTNSGLLQYTAYTYALYNGNTNGSSLILPVNPDNLIQTVTIITGQYVVSLDATYRGNTYVELTYQIGRTNGFASATTYYLIRFSGSSAPNTLVSGNLGTSITSNNTTNITTTYSTNLSPNTQYTYAFYSSNTAGGVKLYDGDNLGVSSGLTYSPVTSYTENMIATIFTMNNFFNNTASVNYNVSNTTNETNGGYLNLYISTAIPSSTFNTSTSGLTALFNDTLISQNSSSTNSNYSISNLVPGNTYYCAFYDGYINGISKIITITGSAQNYLTLQPYGLSNSSITSANINITSATINYSISNASSSSSGTPYLYSIIGTSANSVLNTSTNTYIMNITVNSGSSTTSSYTVSGLTHNTIYTFAFYNKNINLSSPILTNSTSPGGVQKYVTLKTGINAVSLSSNNIYNNTATINYSLSNPLASSATAYLYRFVGSSIGSNPTSGTLVTSININSSASSTSSYNDTGLNGGQQYTYVFFNGTTNTATPLTTSVGASITTTLTTTNLFNSIIDASIVKATSATIDYTLTNNYGSTITAYLYKFSGSSAPTNPTGTPLASEAVTNSGIINSYSDSGLTTGVNYTYAFYNGNTSSAIILTDNLLTNKSVTIYTSSDVVLTSISANTLTQASVIITSNFENYQNISKTAYLYRFNGDITPPNTLNTSLTGAIQLSGGNVTTTQISGTTPGTNTGNFNNTGLTTFQYYTYAFYNGTSNGTSKIITNIYGFGLYTVVYPVTTTVTTNLSSEIVTNKSTTINYTLSNGIGNSQKTIYLYQFPSTDIPSPLDLTNATQIGAPIVLPENTLLTNSIDITTLIPNSNYVYGFYDGNTNGASTINQINSQPLKLSTITTNVVNPTITASNVDYNAGSADINFNITNLSNSTTTIYLYRYIGTEAPTTLAITRGFGTSTLITEIPIYTNYDSSLSYTDPTIAPGITYTYALYNGNTSGSSTILQDGTSNNMSVTISASGNTQPTFYANHITGISADINYQLTNNTETSQTVYLYRFSDNIIPSTTLDLSTTGTTYITPITIPANQSIASYFNDNSLSFSTTYTYAIYSGNVNGSSTMLVDSTGTPLFLTLTTNPDGFCFIGNCKVLMENGEYRKISEIQRGDIVIQDLTIKKTAVVARNYMNKMAGNFILIKKNIYNNSDDIISTHNHPIWSHDNTYRLQACDIPNVENINLSENFYNLQFDEEGTYIVEGIKVDSLSPYHKRKKLPYDLFIDKSKFIKNKKNLLENDPTRNKPKLKLKISSNLK